MRYFALAMSLAAFAASPALAQMTSQPPRPADTKVDCLAFTKLPNGNWYVGSPGTMFAIGPAAIRFEKRNITPHSTFIGDFNLYPILERLCGGH